MSKAKARFWCGSASRARPSIDYSMDVVYVCINASINVCIHVLILLKDSSPFYFRSLYIYLFYFSCPSQTADQTKTCKIPLVIVFLFSLFFWLHVRRTSALHYGEVVPTRPLILSFF